MSTAAGIHDSSAHHGTGRPSLVRAVGRWSVAVVVNSVIGSGVFALPSSVAALVGAASPFAVLLAGVCVFTIVLCCAEVGSRYDRTGGPYLYATQAFGRGIGFHIGWLHLWSRVFSGAAVLTVIAAYAAALLPALAGKAASACLMTAGVAIVTGINVAGVRQAAWTVNVFTVAKVLPLLLLVALGIGRLSEVTLATQAVATPSWLEAILLLVFAYGGFESSVIAAGEMRHPKRDASFALVVGMLSVTAIYTAVQLVVVGVLPRAGAVDAPIARTLDVLLGHGGMTFGALALILSGYGWFSGFALLTPRILYAMADRGELPHVLAHVHPRFRTPHVAILLNSGLALAFALAGEFTQLATLSAIPRVVMWAFVCAALVVLRRREGPAPFRLPAGPAFAMLGIGFSVWLLGTRSYAQAGALALLLALGLVFWLTRARHAEESVL